MLAFDMRQAERVAAVLETLAADGTVAELPLLSSGKPDYQTVRELARRRDARAHNVTGLDGLFAEVLQIDAATIDPDASFVDLGGNSLSYVTMSVRLERALGRLPADWHRLSLRELERIPRQARRSWPWWAATLETSVALRAAAIVLIVGSHAGLFELWGGAHLLLGIAGYNFGRFCLTPAPRAENERRSLMMPTVSTMSMGSRVLPSTVRSVAPSILVWPAAASLSR